MDIQPNSAAPCRAIAFSSDANYLIEANYLGFVTIRCAHSGVIKWRYMAQTTLVETIQIESKTGNVILGGAGFEGCRDYGVVKFLSFPQGCWQRELTGHCDDVTDITILNGSHQQIVTVGLDKRVIVHDLSKTEKTWVWEGSTDYLNTCSARPNYPSHFAVAGDSPYTYIIDSKQRIVVAQVETLGDSNGLAWSKDGRYLLVGSDFSSVKYFDSNNNWQLVATARVGGAAKRLITDPRDSERCLVACYDGRIWSIAQDPQHASSSTIIVDRHRGLWGSNVAATPTRLGVTSFLDRAYLIERDSRGTGNRLIGIPPRPSFGANWLAVNKVDDLLAVTHDDGCIRIREIKTGKLRTRLGPDSLSLCMGTSFHPFHPLLATVDFYGELLIYNTRTGQVTWRRDIGFGPGITVEFSYCGQFLAVGGYRSDAHIFDFGAGDRPSHEYTLETPNRGVIKNVAFTLDGHLLVASSDGSVIMHSFNGKSWRAVMCISGKPPMELCNAVIPTSDSKTAFVASRDQSLRKFNLQTGECIGVGFAHNRGIKTLHISECGKTLVTGSYDRSILIWNPETLTVRLAPLRNANSGISCVRIYNSIIYSCSFDGTVSAWCANSGVLIWSKSSLDSSQGR